MTIEYTPRGVCSRKIIAEVSDSKIVTSVKFVGGCNGNAKGLSALAVGRPVDELIEKLSGIRCESSKSTSCPAQLAEALKQAQ